MDYESVYTCEAFGSEYAYGIDIKVSSPMGKSDAITKAAYKAAALLEQAITREFYSNNAGAQAQARAEKIELLNCFPERNVFIEPISNRYCSRACCEHRPWFRVTTRIGPIIIGWRKQVISIDWSDSIVTTTAERLFADEQVTKDGRLIHAWGYEKAREYLTTLFVAHPRGVTQ